MEQLPKHRSLATQLADLLERAIRDGKWKEFLPGQRALSERFRVSRPTVGLAIAQLRRRGLVCVVGGRRTRVVPQVRRAPARSQSRVIRVLSSLPLDNVSYLTLFSFCELERRVADEGYRLEIHARPNLRQGHPDRTLSRLASFSDAACWVLHAPTVAVQRWFVDRGLRAVVTSTVSEGTALPSVDFDYRAMGRHMAGEFLTRGHRRVGLISSQFQKAGDLLLERSLREGLEVGRPAGVSLVVALSDITPAGCSVALSRLLASPSRPTALVVCGTATAFLVMSVLAKRGIDVPGKVSVVSTLDEPLLAYQALEVAHYHANMKSFARELLRLTLEVAGGDLARPRQVRLIPEFVKGETLGMAPGGGKR